MLGLSAISIYPRVATRPGRHCFNPGGVSAERDRGLLRSPADQGAGRASARKWIRLVGVEQYEYPRVEWVALIESEKVCREYDAIRTAAWK